MEINENLLTGKAKEAKRNEKELKREEEAKDIGKAFDRVFASNDGKLLGKWLMKQCGFLENSVVSNKDGIIPSNTIYNEARRSVYLELRRLLDPETIINLEIRG